MRWMAAREAQETGFVVLWRAPLFNFFSLAMAFCVRYVTNERLITDAALALEDSVKARRQGECLSGEWGEYRVWGRYEPKMWHQIAMLHDVAQSPLTTSMHRQAARKVQGWTVDYFQHEGADYVDYAEETYGREQRIFFEGLHGINRRALFIYQRLADDNGNNEAD